MLPAKGSCIKQASQDVHTRMKTRTVFAGLKMQNDLIGFIAIAPRTFELNANYITGSRRYRPTEQQLWQLNHQINVRGFHIDRAFAEAAREIAEAAAPEIDAEIAEI